VEAHEARGAREWVRGGYHGKWLCLAGPVGARPLIGILLGVSAAVPRRQKQETPVLTSFTAQYSSTGTLPFVC
jgi:hypothetical protein